MNPTRTWTLAVALVLPLIGGGALAGDEGARPAVDVAAAETLALPPATHAPGDPADTLYQTARAALTRGDFRQAARLFRRIVDEEPDSEYAPDALYWQAFSLHRLGGTDQLREAVAALELQRQRFPEAATLGDAEALLVRIRGELARRGDAESAEHVATSARAAVEADRAVREASRAARGRGPSGARVEDDRCEGDEHELRIAALHALMEMDSDRAIPILERVLERRDECSELLRERAVFIVAESETERAQEILLRVARTDPHPEVRAKAVFWLSEVDDPRAIDALEQILFDAAAETALRERALFALAESEGARSGEILRRYALDASQPVDLRERAIFWLSEDETPGNAEFLKDLFGRIDDPSLRERILFAVAESDEPGAAEWLIDVSRNASLSPELRGRALFWAAESGDLEAYPSLLDLWDQVDHPEIKRQLLFAYAEMDTEASIDKLYEIARSDEDVEVRKRALMWLGESEDPRVIELLEEMVTQ